jgi:hypothetical protein
VTLSDPFERYYVGQDPAHEYVGVREEDLEKVASEHGVHQVRVVVRDGWFGWSPHVVPCRLSVIVTDGKVERAWWA